MVFHNEYSRPTPEQFAIIGEIVTDAAVVDLLVCHIVSRLAGMADFAGLAVMDKMFLRQRTEAADRLLNLHHYRYRYQRLDEATVKRGKALMEKVRKRAATRNDAAHAILFRATDEGVFAFKPEGRQGDAPRTLDPEFVINGPLSNTDLRRFATALARLAEELEAFLALLPEAPEAPAAR